MEATPQLPPGPRGLALLRAGVSFFRDPLRQLLEVSSRYGDIACLRRTCILSHPAHMRDVLVTHNKQFIKTSAHLERLVGNGLFLSNGDFHLRQRRLMQPAFHHGRLVTYGAVMVDFARRRCQRWRPGETLNVHREMLELTQVIVAKALLDTSLEDEANDFAHAMTDALEANLLTDRLPLPGFLHRLIPTRRFQTARARLDAAIGRAIAEHRSDERDRGDLLTMLLRAQDTEGGTGGLTDEQVRDEAVTLFMAGHETTAAALTWTWHVLGQHPDVETRLHAEVDAALAGRYPEVADIPRLGYVRLVVAEALRLYPPFWVLRRIVAEEYQVDGFTLPVGTVVLLNTWALHHDPRWYPDPWRFDPARMTPEAQAARDRYTFVPFGAGPRECIGEHFAWMELVLVVATISQHWRLRPAPSHTVVPMAAVSLRPRGGMPMVPEPRGEKP